MIFSLEPFGDLVETAFEATFLVHTKCGDWIKFAVSEKG